MTGSGWPNEAAFPDTIISYRRRFSQHRKIRADSMLSGSGGQRTTRMDFCTVIGPDHAPGHSTDRRNCRRLLSFQEELILTIVVLGLIQMDRYVWISGVKIVKVLCHERHRCMTPEFSKSDPGLESGHERIKITRDRYCQINVRALFIFGILRGKRG